MKKSRFCLMVLSLLLICAMLFNLSGCSKISATDLMKDVTPRNVTIPTYSYSPNASVTDFAVRLFHSSQEDGENTLISPLSVLYALALTANGAEGETLKEMESVIGIDKEMLNFYLYDYLKNLPQDDKNKLSLANSIWFTDDERFTVNQDFLQTNADYYGADIYKAPFNSQTCKDINNWVNKKTDKMIPEILDKIPAEAVMYLVNALAFDAEWEEIYEKDQVKNGEFTKSDGTTQETEFMYSTECFYLEDQNAKGFIKYYKNGKYAFVAMLPNEDVSLENYVASLDGKALYGLLQNPQPDTVYAAIPKFETEYSTNMVSILSDMGMPRAFNDTLAQFQGLGTSTAGNIYIGRVLHKTFISVSEKGTKAGATTLIEMTDNAAPAEPKRVYLNRPFVYMLIDTQNKIPFFIGTMNDIKK